MMDGSVSSRLVCLLYRNLVMCSDPGFDVRQDAPTNRATQPGQESIILWTTAVLHAVYHGLSINVSFRAFLYCEDIGCKQLRALTGSVVYKAFRRAPCFTL